MKKFILIIALILTSLLCTAQTFKHNTIYVAFQPVDLGYGLRYDYRLNKHTGLYGSATHGNYYFENYFDGGYIKNHNKLSIGAIHYLPLENNYPKSESFISLGINYHKYGNISDTSNMINHKALKPVSIDLGVGVAFNEKFTLALRFDFIKNESTLDLGWKF